MQEAKKKNNDIAKSADTRRASYISYGDDDEFSYLEKGALSSSASTAAGDLDHYNTFPPPTLAAQLPNLALISPTGGTETQGHSPNLHASMYSTINMRNNTSPPQFHDSLSSELADEFHTISTKAYYGGASSQSQPTAFGDSVLLGMLKSTPTEEAILEDNGESRRHHGSPLQTTTTTGAPVDHFAIAAAGLKAASQDSQESSNKFDSMLIFDEEGIDGSQVDGDFISTSDLFFE